MRQITITCAAAALLCSIACAGPKFYKVDASNHEQETGIPIYPARIFLVAAVDDKGATSVTVVRLPNLAAEPIYARNIRGWGSGELSVEFDGGVLKSVGGKSDSQAADTIDALGSLIGAAGDVVKATHQGVTGAEEPAFRVYEVIMDKDGTRLVPVSVAPK